MLLHRSSPLHTEVQRISYGTNWELQRRRGARTAGIVSPVKAPFRRSQPAAPETDPSTGAEAPSSVEQPTVVAPPLDLSAAPATAPPAAPLDPPPFAPAAPPSAGGNRAKLRRRMRYLRRAHELGLRDLGGLVFDLHRFGRRNDQLVVGKLQALETVDAELRAIERVLGAHRDVLELREPGITACVRCGALHGTDARFCPSCGTQVDGLVAVGGAPAAAAPATSEAPPMPAAPVTPAPGPAPAPPVPASGPAPAAPPLWSVPQPTAEHDVVAEPAPFAAPDNPDPPTAVTPPEPTP